MAFLFYKSVFLHILPTKNLVSWRLQLLHHIVWSATPRVKVEHITGNHLHQEVKFRQFRGVYSFQTKCISQGYLCHHFHHHHHHHHHHRHHHQSNPEQFSNFAPSKGMIFCIKVSRMKCLTRMSQATNACEYMGGIRKNLGGNAEKLATG